MARQVIDTNPPIGDPAPTAFGKVNAMTAELYPLATGALPKSGGTMTGELVIASGAAARIVGTPGTVYWDSRSNSTVNLPDATARYRAAQHFWDNGSGNWLAELGATAQYKLQGSGAGFTCVDRVDFAQTWSMYVTGTIWSLWNNTNGNVVSVSRTGAMTALAFNPISSADVKDYIEGYSGDADDELNRMVVIEYNYRPEFIESDKRCVGLLAENVADVHPSASDPESVVQVQVEVEREVDVPYPVEREVQVEVLTPVEDFDPDEPKYVRSIETVTETVTEYRKEKRMVPEMVESVKPRNVDIMQILALSVRAHQQKSKRIRDLEATLTAAVARIEALETAA